MLGLLLFFGLVNGSGELVLEEAFVIFVPFQMSSMTSFTVTVRARGAGKAGFADEPFGTTAAAGFICCSGVWR